MVAVVKGQCGKKQQKKRNAAKSDVKLLPKSKEILSYSVIYPKRQVSFLKIERYDKICTPPRIHIYHLLIHIESL